MPTLAPNQIRIFPQYFYFSREVLTREPKVAGRSLVLSSGCDPFKGLQWQPTPVLLPGKSHGWRRLVGCNSWDC